MARALTVEQAAEFLQLSPYTVRLWLREGKIPGRKIGRAYRILDTDLEAMVGTNRIPAAGAVREKAQVRYLEELNMLEPRLKPKKLVAKGMLAHVPGLSVENYLKDKREDQEKENRQLP